MTGSELAEEQKEFSNKTQPDLLTNATVETAINLAATSNIELNWLNYSTKDLQIKARF